MVYPALLPLLPLMRTPRLLVVDWTDAPADLNGLVLFTERRNLVSARVPSHFKRSLPYSYPVVWCSVLVLVLQVDSIHAKCVNKVLAVLQPKDRKTHCVLDMQLRDEINLSTNARRHGFYVPYGSLHPDHIRCDADSSWKVRRHLTRQHIIWILWNLNIDYRLIIYCIILYYIYYIVRA